MVPVYFVVPAGLVLLDLAGPAEAFRIANKLRPGSFALHYCGPEPEVECGLAGLHLSRLAPLPASLPAQALVVVPGVVDAAFQLDRPPLRAVVDWLARCSPPRPGCRPIASAPATTIACPAWRGSSLPRAFTTIAFLWRMTASGPAPASPPASTWRSTW
ncbi:AraC family transcriptional regulator [Bordetella pertussis]|nr:AraC family transcriptional regulator [Bordetella pertussis]